MFSQGLVWAVVGQSVSGETSALEIEEFYGSNGNVAKDESCAQWEDGVAAQDHFRLDVSLVLEDASV